MAKPIIWAAQAHRDRKEILQYWRTRNQSNTYSKKLNELFKKAVRLIAQHPYIGRKTDLENIRVKPVRDYLIVYEETPLRIEILTIWDTRRDPEDLKKRIG
jgi:addiction module RelE/StbE family toxin